MEPEISNQNKPFNWADFISFRHMIALQVIQVLYIVIAVLITLGGLAAMFVGVGYGYGQSGGNFLYGLLVIVIGNIFWRLWCELVIVMFRINKTLSNIDDNTKK